MRARRAQERETSTMLNATSGRRWRLVLSLLAVFEGYNAIPTAEGVSRGTTRTVVISAIVVFVLDYMLTSVLLQR